MHANSYLGHRKKYYNRILTTIFLFFGSIIIIQAQSIVSGTISDAETGELLPVVNVYIKGKQIGTVSDMNGFYSLKIPSETGMLQFSYIGYLTQAADIKNREKVNIQLKQDKLELEYQKTYSKDEAFALLKRERQLEFMAEQSRFNDLKRWGILAEEMNPELKEIPNSGLVESKHYLFPIPQLELDTNLEFGEVTDSWN